MIQDEGQVLLAAAPASTLFVGSSFGYDLNPDFGTGQNARKAPLVGQGEDWMLRLDVVDAFSAAAGTPIIQFHAVLSTVGAGVVVHTGDTAVIGSLMPSTHVVSGRTMLGFHVAQLPAGAHFFMRLNPWTARMGRNVAGTTIIGKDLRYLGVLITVPNFDQGGNPAANGSIAARILKSSEISQDPKDFAYPSGTRIVG